MRDKPLPDVRQQSFEGQLCQLAIGEEQAKAHAPDISEPMDVIRDRLVVPLFHLVRSVSFISCTPVKKYLQNCFSRSAHVMMEFAGKEENQAKADPDSETGNK